MFIAQNFSYKRHLQTMSMQGEVSIQDSSMNVSQTAEFLNANELCPCTGGEIDEPWSCL